MQGEVQQSDNYKFIMMQDKAAVVSWMEFKFKEFRDG
jgi:hypothetical protein